MTVHLKHKQSNTSRSQL